MCNIHINKYVVIVLISVINLSCDELKKPSAIGGLPSFFQHFENPGNLDASKAKELKIGDLSSGSLRVGFDSKSCRVAEFEFFRLEPWHLIQFECRGKISLEDVEQLAISMFSMWDLKYRVRKPSPAEKHGHWSWSLDSMSGQSKQDIEPSFIYYVENKSSLITLRFNDKCYYRQMYKDKESQCADLFNKTLKILLNELQKIDNKK